MQNAAEGDGRDKQGCRAANPQGHGRGLPVPPAFGCLPSVGQPVAKAQAATPQQQAIDHQRRYGHAIAAQHENAIGLHAVGHMVGGHADQQPGRHGQHLRGVGVDVCNPGAGD
ncbi:hypothetical protein SDC9_210759 [bioreactor metagenome]|uniref:Uncharacterized protein n=1 Tax=bioreactor metagenome TaxID=1076179 RepID=A0A645JH39_9ZZZZ